MTIVERKYQTRDKKDIKKAFTQYRSVLYQCPTGGGKSVVAADLVDEWLKKDVNILIMAHRRELLQQFNTHFSGRDIKVGMMRGKIERSRKKEQKNMKIYIGSPFVALSKNMEDLETLIYYMNKSFKNKTFTLIKNK